MADKRTSPQKHTPRSKTSTSQPPNLQLGDHTLIRGDLNYAGRDLIKNIKIIHQRALTAAEAAEKGRSLEIKLLAQGLGKYSNSLKDRIEGRRDISTPYRGLLSYDIEDVETFFGRKEAKQEVAKRLSRSNYSVLYSESGAGKTSLLLAGIMPVILASGHLPVYLRPYDKNPAEVIKHTLLPDSEFAPGLMQEPLPDFLSRATEILGSKTSLILILDQFEEFFFQRVQPADRKAFIDDLSACINNPSLNVRWLFCLREEDFTKLNTFRPGILNPLENSLDLHRLTHAEAEAAIVEPAKLQGLTFEDGLITELLNDLGGETILPPHLQLVCSALVDNLHEQQKIFTHAEYVKLDKAQGILKDHLDRVLNTKIPKSQVNLCQQVLQGLVASTQQRVLRTEHELLTALKNFPKDQIHEAINLLAANRLLRGEETPDGLAYELAHDTLLDQIKLNPAIIKQKQAEELLEQGVKNWHRQKILLAPDALKIIEAETANLFISSAVAKLLFLSEVEYNQPAERWVDSISPEDRKELINSLLSEKSNVKNQAALWALRRHLAKPHRAKITLVRSTRATSRFVRNGVLVLLIGIGVLILGMAGVNLSLHFVPWTKMSSFNRHCLGGGTSSDLLVAVDTMDKAHVAVYDLASHTLCETWNTGSTWKLNAGALPANLKINSIAVYKRIFLATNQGLYYQNQDSTWKNVRPSTENNSAFRKIAVAADDKQIYISNEQDQLLRYSLATGQWDDFPTEGVTGKITDIAANYKYFAVSTTNGVWYTRIDADKLWDQFDLKEDVTIRTIKMVHPVRSWFRSLSNSADDDWFLATADQGGFYFGYLTESGGLDKMSELPAGAVPVASLAVHDYSKFVAGPSGLYCEQSWNILDPEWWLRFSSQPPCK